MLTRSMSCETYSPAAVYRYGCPTRKNDLHSLPREVGLDEGGQLALSHVGDGFHSGLPRRLGRRLFIMSFWRVGSG